MIRPVQSPTSQMFVMVLDSVATCALLAGVHVHWHCTARSRGSISQGYSTVGNGDSGQRDKVGEEENETRVDEAASLLAIPELLTHGHLHTCGPKVQVDNEKEQEEVPRAGDQDHSRVKRDEEKLEVKQEIQARKGGSGELGGREEGARGVAAGGGKGGRRGPQVEKMVMGNLAY
ncbi:hypothetical protein INR49_030748 [Caranx melampygus]|nr:hypothetical protein INR49_030748 [Caranx melampygus]